MTSQPGPPLTPSILTAPLTLQESRQIEEAIATRVRSMLDMVNVLHEGLARTAYESAVAAVSGARKMGLDPGRLLPFEDYWEARKIREQQETGERL